VALSKDNLPTVPTLLHGAASVDDRGVLTYINGFPLQSYKRFYTVSNHSQGFVRAWHGHMLESKTLFVLQGSILACAVKMTDVKSPDKNQEITRVVLDSRNPAALFVPSGFANGFMSLTADSTLLIFSSTTLEESKGDDYRFPFDYWNPWEIVPR
jgi:dTDP-4-dehydrorhamnose 3,5-epimerase